MVAGTSVDGKGWMIHILQGGVPLCSFTKKTPTDWPTGHQWVSRHDHLQATCTECCLRFTSTVVDQKTRVYKRKSRR